MPWATASLTVVIRARQHGWDSSSLRSQNDGASVVVIFVTDARLLLVAQFKAGTTTKR